MPPRKTAKPAAPPSDSAGRFAYEGLERVLHEKARLGIMTSLAAHPQGLLFNELKELCALTDGNLNRHLKVLQEEQLVELWKGYSQRRPQTLVRITALGRERFLEYVTVLEQVVSDAARLARADAAEQAASAPPVASRLGWAPG
ncbi:MAG: transcriptional regulator [Planctomycetaceae bacterium]